jgi:hypothetical protein
MAGNYAADNVEIDFFDNFHRVSSMSPEHFPQFENLKTCNGKDKCTLKGYTVSENKYLIADGLDTGSVTNSAWETKCKMLSK